MGSQNVWLPLKLHNSITANFGETVRFVFQEEIIT